MSGCKPNVLTKNHGNNSKQGQLKKPVLPPIIRVNDQMFLDEIRNFIDEERKKLDCQEDVFDEKRFLLYSAALDKLINHTTSYKEILSDIKREYEYCIRTITNGQREMRFVENKVKALSSLPTTIAGYSQRKMELQNKLEILNKANKELEERYEKVKLASTEHEKKIENEEFTGTPEILEEKRPIPGLSVEQWTDIETLKHALTRLSVAVEDLSRQQKTNYVLLEQKIKSDKVLNERILTHDELLNEVKILHSQNQRLKIAHDAMTHYKKKKIANPRFKLSIGQYILSRLLTQQMMERKLLSFGIDAGLPDDDDDPGMEKEAELMLEYIDKFNELFGDGEYDNAAIHAANSPRGILRNMETLNRFRDVSLNFVGTPSPILLYAIALMNSSSAQSHIADKDMSIVCAEWALKENRPDLVKHWVTIGCITSSNELAHSLIAYSEKVPAYKATCLVVAQKMFAEVENHHDSCVALYQLHHFKALIDYAKEIAKFSKNDYLELLRNCPDGGLVISLCESQPEQEDEEDEYTSKVLPLRFDQAIYAMLQSKTADSQDISRFLMGLKDGNWASHATGDKLSPDCQLHSIVYEETDEYTDEATPSRWPQIKEYCDQHDLGEVALEIEAAITVKLAIIKAITAIGQAGKEEFDYYT